MISDDDDDEKDANGVFLESPPEATSTQTMDFPLSRLLLLPAKKLYRHRQH